jgi:hypothetical protein
LRGRVLRLHALLPTAVAVDGTATHDPANGLRIPNFVVAPEKQSFDVVTGSFNGLFDFDAPPNLEQFIL